MKFKGLIFDFNGVLLWDQHLHDQVFQNISTEIRGRGFTDDELAEHLHGRPNQSIFSYLLGKELSQEEGERYGNEKELRYQQVAKNTSEYQLSPGAESLLQKLTEKGTPMTIATSSPRMNVVFFEKELHLSKWFDIGKIACTEGKVRGKPHPDLFLSAAENIGLAPSECVIIEDARTGIQAAKAAGIGYIIALAPKEKHTAFSEIDGVNKVIETLSEVDVDELF